MKVGAEKDVVVTFPEDYHAEELKGKEATFKIKVHEIKQKQLPELDDEFAKDVDDDVETFAELQEKIKNHQKRTS
ncbi:cell division trigger factor [Sporolactobacillus inulinus]|uniref:Cell division trigger factor n=1 Tax=Sporolactobacillus inulinus TaxID=2078 RepID=A0A4Y1Z7Z0_9BACL|nr:cell division trigger factor [Sporolactobacillus inulinus]